MMNRREAIKSLAALAASTAILAGVAVAAKAHGSTCVICGAPTPPVETRIQRIRAGHPELDVLCWPCANLWLPSFVDGDTLEHMRATARAASAKPASGSTP